MFPTTRANTTVVTTILSTLDRGSGTGTPSNGTTGSINALPFYPSMPADLVNRVITTVLTGTSTFSTAGLAVDSVAILANIRTRVDEAVSSIYADTPNISPYNYGNGAVKGTSLREGRRDLIIQQLFNYDARYFLRKRASATQGGVNEFYELPSRHNYMNTPYIEALLRRHTISSGTVDDTGVAGAYRIVSATKHGIYDITEGGLGRMSFWRAGYTGTSILNKNYYVDDLYQEISSNALGTDTDSHFKFNANIGVNYLIDGNVSVTSNIGYAVGGQILGTDVNSALWQALAYQPTRYFKLRNSGTEFQFFHDAALTEQLIPGYGYVSDNNYNTTENTIQVTASNATGTTEYTHLMFQDTPQVFDQPTGWTGNAGVVDRLSVTSYVSRPSAGSFFNGAVGDGLSIYDGQPINLVSPGTGFLALNNDPVMTYSKGLDSVNNDIQLYTDVGLTQIYNIGEEISLLSNIAYTSGNARVTFNTSFPAMADGVGIYIDGSTTNFSDNYNVDSRFANNVCVLNSVHVLMNGQPVYRVQAPDQIYYAETTGFTTSQARFHTGATWSGATPTFTGNTAMPVNDDIRPAWYVKRISNTVYELYLDQALTQPYTTVISTAGFTTCNSRPVAFTLTFNSGTYLQPMFFTIMNGYKTALLYRDAARTLPYQYAFANAVPGTGSISSTVLTEGGNASRYRVNNQGMAFAGAGFSSNLKSIDANFAQAYWPKVINDTTVDLYADPGRNAPVKAPAIASAQSTTGLEATYMFDGQYRLDSFNAYNVGGSTYEYDSTGDGIADTVGVGWNTMGEYYYTPHFATQEMTTHSPTIEVESYNFANAGAYYGHLRNITSNVSLVSATGPVYRNPADFGAVDSGPLAYALNDPGMFLSSQVFAVGIERFPDVVNTVTGADDLALANTAPQWDSINNMIDRNIREWPTTTNPSSVTWTIEQPNQTIDSINLTRYSRAKEATRYRIRYVYPPMTYDDARPYIDVIHASRGSFKPFKLQVPTGTGLDERTSENGPLTIRIWDRASNTYVPAVMRVREEANGGTRLLKLDGAPINLNKTVGNASIGTSYVIGQGHAMAARHPYQDNAPGYLSTLGGWMLPIHEVESNSYGEMNIRLNNGVPGVFEVGARMFRDAAYLNVVLDGDSVEIKVDVLGYHYLEVDFLTVKIF